MKINLRIEALDGTTKDIVAIAADLVAFETKFDLSIARLEKEIKLSHLLYIAWHIEKRTKSTPLEFEPWVETISSVGIAETPKS